MKVTEILHHFLDRADWVDPDSTVDRVLFGDPGIDVDRCAVTWMASLRALRAAVEQGIRLVVCHEPLFWHHLDDRPEDDPATLAKTGFLQEHDLVVLRNHDCWDRWPGVGIPWAWASFLRLPGAPVEIGADGYQHRYDIRPRPLDEFAREVAERCRTLGEPVVQVTGDASATVARIGIGTGCCCDLQVFRDIGCDTSIVCDDGSCYWAGIQRADDLEHGVIRVNHGTSEEPGMITLARYINEHLDGVGAEHFPHGATFHLVGEP